jgi:hypothetical protein
VPPPNDGAPAGRRSGFHHPLAAAHFAAAQAAFARGAPFRPSYLPPLLASAMWTARRRPWIARTTAAVNATPDDWHLTSPPVFVVGFWRSGTTLLHELMSCDPALAAPSIVDVLCPADAPFLLGAKRELIARLLPPDRGVDAVELRAGAPQEEEWALAQLGAPSLLLAFYFPEIRERLIDECLFLQGPESRSAWRAAHLRFLRTLVVRHPGRRLLLKNPANSTRLPELRELYPAARFVRIDREPSQVLPSLRRMMDRLAADFSLQGRAAPFRQDEAERLHARVMAKLDQDWRLIPSELRFAVRYDRLTEFPLRTLERIYAALGLALTEEVRRNQRRFWLKHGRKRPTFASASASVGQGEDQPGSRSGH